MFRKFIVTVVMMAAVIAASAALPIDKYTINRKDLPEAAREMLDEHFPKAKVSMIKVDRHLLKKTDYDVKLSNGTKIEFSNKGQWTNVDCKKKSVPEALVPKTIRNHVSKKHDGENIVRITRTALYYTIGLSNGKNLKFDKLGIFQGEVTDKEVEQTDTDDTEEVAENSL